MNRYVCVIKCELCKHCYTGPKTCMLSNHLIVGTSGNIPHQDKHLRLSCAPKLLLTAFVCVQYSNHSLIAVELMFYFYS